MADVENQGGDSGAENEPNCPWWLKWGAKILGRFQKFPNKLFACKRSAIIINWRKLWIIL